MEVNICMGYETTTLLISFLIYQHETNNTDILCAETVQYMCVVIIAAITLYVSSSAVIYIHGHIMPSNLATVRQVLDNNTIQL